MCRPICKHLSIGTAWKAVRQTENNDTIFIILNAENKYRQPQLTCSKTNAPFESCRDPISTDLTRSQNITGWSKKRIPSFIFWDNFGNSAPILIILSLLQA